jgi:hypothetical protein
MRNQSKPNKMDIDIAEIDFNKLFRVGGKVRAFLGKKIDAPIEIYLLLKILCYSIEDGFGFRIDAEDELKFRKMFS